MPQSAASRIYGVQRGDPLQLAAALTWLYLTYAWHFQQSTLAKTRAALQRARILRKAFAHLPVGDADRLTVGHTIPYFQDVLRCDRPQDEFWAAMDHSQRVPEITAPVHLVGGWYDFFLPDQLADHRALRDAGRNPYLTIGPWTHATLSAVAEGLRQSLAWYDAHLRNNRFTLRATPVRVYVTGARQWADLDAWPPPSTPTP